MASELLLELARAVNAAGCVVLPDGGVVNRRAEELERELKLARTIACRWLARFTPDARHNAEHSRDNDISARWP